MRYARLAALATIAACALAACSTNPGGREFTGAGLMRQADAAARPGEGNARPDRQQYYDQRTGRYYYFDRAMGRYYYANGQPYP